MGTELETDFTFFPALRDVTASKDTTPLNEELRALRQRNEQRLAELKKHKALTAGAINCNKTTATLG
jgi:hypothetical protein